MLDDHLKAHVLHTSAYCFHTASHVSVRLPLGVPKVKKIAKTARAFSHAKSVARCQGMMFS